MNEFMPRKNSYADLATALGDGAMASGIFAATSIGLISVAILIVASLLRAFGVFPAELYQHSVIGLIFLAAFVMAGIIVLSLVKSMGHRDRVEKSAIGESKLDSAAPPAPTPAALPPLTAPRLIPVSANGSRGVLAVDLIDGWLDPQTADWFALYLVSGFKWTENELKDREVPYSNPPTKFGKHRSDPPSPYRKLMDKCVVMEIIVNRGGPGNDTGDLAIRDVKEIARRLKLPSPSE